MNFQSRDQRHYLIEKPMLDFHQLPPRTTFQRHIALPTANLQTCNRVSAIMIFRKQEQKISQLLAKETAVCDREGEESPNVSYETACEHGGESVGCG